MLDLADPIERPPDAFTGREIKQTRSLCPQCLEMIDARVFEREGKVWMDKNCPDHGSYTALLADDVRHYYVADPRVEALGSCCGPSGCAPPAPRHSGDQVVNHSCNMLIDKCCVHIIATDGTPVSFCEYNARNRPMAEQGRQL